MQAIEHNERYCVTPEDYSQECDCKMGGLNPACMCGNKIDLHIRHRPKIHLSMLKGKNVRKITRFEYRNLNFKVSRFINDLT